MTNLMYQLSSTSQRPHILINEKHEKNIKYTPRRELNALRVLIVKVTDHSPKSCTCVRQSPNSFGAIQPVHEAPQALQSALKATQAIVLTKDTRRTSQGGWLDNRRTPRQRW